MNEVVNPLPVVRGWSRTMTYRVLDLVSLDQDLQADSSSDPEAHGTSGKVSRPCLALCSSLISRHRFGGVQACAQDPEPCFHHTIGKLVVRQGSERKIGSGFHPDHVFRLPSHSRSVSALDYAHKTSTDYHVRSEPNTHWNNANGSLHDGIQVETTSRTDGSAVRSNRVFPWFVSSEILSCTPLSTTSPLLDLAGTASRKSRSVSWVSS
jgi:hypothetical protein